jgi:hypothetical protein
MNCNGPTDDTDIEKAEVMITEKDDSSSRSDESNSETDSSNSECDSDNLEIDSDNYDSNENERRY